MYIRKTYHEWFALKRSSLVFMFSWILLPRPAIAQSDRLPVDLDYAFSAAKPLIVMIAAQGDELRNGAGVIIGSDVDRVYVVTASHVVWSGDTPISSITLYVEGSGGTTKSVDAHVVQAAHAPTYNADGSRGLDLAVLWFDRRVAPYPVNSLPFGILGDTKQLRAREKLYPVGFPNGQKKWSLSPIADHYDSSSGFLLFFNTNSVTGGYSGGPLFNSKFQLVGIISSDTSASSDAIAVDDILRALAQWHIPTQLAPGEGVIIIGDEDRPRFPLADATASISIWLLSGTNPFANVGAASPALSAFTADLRSAIQVFSRNNPNYNNQRPRELFYFTYTNQNGAVVPDVVTVYTDSPYWPDYGRYPAVHLASRLQGSTFNFYLNPINPQNFNPQRPGADLSFGVGINWVKYGAPDRQLQAEAANGRLELEYSVSRNTLEQFAWMLRAPMPGWQTNGSISSLLDLRGAQLIVSTVVGNLGGRNDVKSDFDAIREHSRLNYIALSMGKGSLKLTPENTTEYRDRDGNFYFVYQFPKTSREFLKVFQ
jgi:S1-C subfamily serine protease